MKPGTLLQIHKFEEYRGIFVYLGPARKFNPESRTYEGRFLSTHGEIEDIDVGNYLVWNFKVIS